MVKPKEVKKDIEWEIAEAEIELAIAEYENWKWLHPLPKEEKDGS